MTRVEAMKIICLGGGPSGLYLAISMKLRNPAHDITVYERNRPGDTFGWGVVFSDETMQNLKENSKEANCTLFFSFFFA
jgi:anthraniloyl-CoA monooxygenase